MPKKGCKMAKEHKIKIGKANQISLLGHHCSPQTEFKKGHKINNGKNNPNYKDGRSTRIHKCIDCKTTTLWSSKRCKKCWHKFNKGWHHHSHIKNLIRIYPVIFKKIGELIRKRYNYICQVCGKYQKNRKFDVHHIDYDKNNNKRINLIILCLKCHRKTNHNRDYWYAYFKYIIKSKE